MASRDLTAILLPAAEHDPGHVRRAVAVGGYGDVWLRVRPLGGELGLLQVEVFDQSGLPCVDPALVAALSSQKRHAVFAHVNHEAKQAIVHAFEDGREVEGWLGTPDGSPSLDEKLGKALGRTLDELLAGDDGTRQRFGYAASSTVGLVRGRVVGAPTGLPTGLHTFQFHDRNLGGDVTKPGEPAAGHPDGPSEGDGGDRVALLAFDGEGLRKAWQETPGRELAARVHALPEQVLGPLAGARAEVIAALGALGDRTPRDADLRSVRALELLLLGETLAFTGGDATRYIDQRLLPMFSLGTGDPSMDDPDEAEALEEATASVLHAMVDVLPYGSPEGSLLEQLEDGELAPLAPWSKPGEEYVGAIFALRAERVQRLMLGIDERDLAARVDRFYRAWWKAQTDDPMGDEFEAWRKQMDERGGADLNRFLIDWTEWRTVLALAGANRLQTALLFYG